MLLLVTILKALNEVALYALLGQDILYGRPEGHLLIGAGSGQGEGLLEEESI